MAVLFAVVGGILLFAVATLALGWWLRHNPSKPNAEWASRVMHFLFFVFLNFVPLLLFITPGITHLDDVVGVAPLEPRLPWALAGVVLAVPGLYLLVVTNKALRALGDGANAFRLTRRVVHADVYHLTRNPMSLGYYLWVVAVGLMSGSTAFTLLAILGLVPSHLLFLLYFEAFELPLRLGPAYEEYRQRTPFLIPRPVWRT